MLTWKHFVVVIVVVMVISGFVYYASLSSGGEGSSRVVDRDLQITETKIISTPKPRTSTKSILKAPGSGKSKKAVTWGIKEFAGDGHKYRI